MKSRQFTAVTAAIIVFFPASCLYAAGAANLIANPSFEQFNMHGSPVSWTMPPVSAGFSWAVDRKIKHSGKYSLRITGKNVRGRFVGLRYGQSIRLKRNRVYEISGWVKAENLTFTTGEKRGNLLWFHQYAGKEQRLSDWYFTVDNGSYNWKRFSCRFTTDADVHLMPVDPIGLNGTIWLDDFAIRELGTVPERPSVNASELVAHYKNLLKSNYGNLAILFAPSTKKILRKMTPNDEIFSDGDSARISLAKNEHEAIQLVIVPLNNNFAKVNITISQAISVKTGNLSDGLKISWHPVGYVGYSNGRRLVSEPWPDVLLPAGEFDIRRNELQPVWVEVYAGEKTPAGDYEAHVTVKAINSPDTVTAKLNIHVYDFAIPKKSTLPTAFGARLPATQNMLYAHRLGLRRIFAHRKGFYIEDPEIGRSKPFREFADVRPIVEKTLEEYLAKGGTTFAIDMPYFRGCCAGAMYSAGAHGDFNLIYNDKQADYVIRYHRDFARFLREKGLLQNAFVYLWDEPTPARFKNILTIRELIRKADPDIRCMVDGGFYDAIIDAVDIWTITPKEWNCNRKLAATFRSRGGEIWWYTCGVHNIRPYATFNPIDPKYDLISGRLLFWMVWQYRVKGFLYFTTDWWKGTTETSPRFGLFRRIGNTTDCWWYKGPGGNIGDGYLVYPVPNSDNNSKVLSTIRLEAIRDGLEDREYFVVLERAIKAAKGDSKLKGKCIQAEKFLKVPTNIVESLTHFTRNDYLLRAHRGAVALSIESIARDK